jgi:hypothetical protein
MFLPEFVAKINRGDDRISKREIVVMKKITKVIGKGAREVLRVHTEQNIVNRGVELCQLSIKPFLVKPSALDDEGVDVTPDDYVRTHLEDEQAGFQFDLMPWYSGKRQRFVISQFLGVRSSTPVKPEPLKAPEPGDMGPL